MILLRKILSIKKGGTFPLFLLLFTFSCSAQQRQIRVQSSSLNDAIFHRGHVGFTLMPLVVNRATVKKYNGKYDMGSSAQLGLEMGIKRYLNIDEKHAVVFGLSGVFNGRNYRLFINKNDYDPPAIGDQIYNGALTREKDLFFISLPLAFERRFLRDNKYWNIAAGLNFRYSFQKDDLLIQGFMYNTDGQMIKDLEMEMNINNQKKPWINYNLGIGRGLILKNQNLLQAGLMMNLSFTDFVSGKYNITVPGQPITNGFYGVKGTSIGLSINYIITGRTVRETK